MTGHCSIQVKLFPNKARAITTLERLINLIMKFIDPYKSLSGVKNILPLSYKLVAQTLVKRYDRTHKILVGFKEFKVAYYSFIRVQEVYTINVQI